MPGSKDQLAMGVRKHFPVVVVFNGERFARSGQWEGSCSQQCEKPLQKAWCFRGLLTLKYARFGLHGENAGKAIKVHRV